MGNLEHILNPALAASTFEGTILLGQSARTACPLQGDPSEVIRRLNRLRESSESRSAEDRDFLEQLPLQALVNRATAEAMLKDRRIAAWSLVTCDPQQSIKIFASARVVIFGLGGVGSALAYALAKEGIGELCLVDDDAVVEENLTKSFVFNKSHVGKRKVEVLKEVISQIGPNVTAHNGRMGNLDLDDLLSGAQAVVWGGDDREPEAFDELALECSRRNLPVVTGGVVELSVCVGPTLLPQDITEFLRARKCVPARSAQLEEFNSRRVNPGLFTTVILAATLLANEVLLTLAGLSEPPLRRRRLTIDAISLAFTSEEVIFTTEG